MVAFEITSCIRGYHHYQSIWMPGLVYEGTNDRYAVSVVKDDIIVGHLPRAISHLFAFSAVLTRKRAL